MGLQECRINGSEAVYSL